MPMRVTALCVYVCVLLSFILFCVAFIYSATSRTPVRDCMIRSIIISYVLWVCVCACFYVLASRKFSFGTGGDGVVELTVGRQALLADCG